MSDEALATVLEPVTELALPQEETLAKFSENANLEDFISSYLPRLQLCDASSKPAKTGKIPIGHYAIIHNNLHIDLGKEVRLWVLSRRFKAMDMNEGVKSFYNPKHPEFQRIRAKSDVKDSGCMCGLEFLCYIPDLEKFVTFFMASKSARRESGLVDTLRGKPCLLKTQWVEKKPHSWWAILAAPSTTPLNPPPQDERVEQMYRFNNPPEEEVETVQAGETRER